MSFENRNWHGGGQWQGHAGEDKLRSTFLEPPADQPTISDNPVNKAIREKAPRNDYNKAPAESYQRQLASGFPYQKGLADNLQSKGNIQISDATALPALTVESDQQFNQRLIEARKTLGQRSIAMPQKVESLDLARSALLAPDLRPNSLQNKSDQDPKGVTYLAQAMLLGDNKQSDGADLVRRSRVMQKETSRIGTATIFNTFAGIGPDRAGQAIAPEQIDALLRNAIKDRCAFATIPVLADLVNRIHLEDTSREAAEKQTPGRTALCKALEIVRDEKQGSAAERLEKSRVFFENAIGASDQIDLKQTYEEMAKINQQRIALFGYLSPEKQNELGTRLLDLVDQAILPYRARLKFALALNDAAAENHDEKLSQQAVSLLQVAEKLDPAYKFDPLIQGALILASRRPAEKFNEDKAESAGRLEIEKRKETAGSTKGKPWWQRVLKVNP